MNRGRLSWRPLSFIGPNISDLLIGATLSDADVLVTEGKRFQNRAEILASGRIWSFEMFCKYVSRQRSLTRCRVVDGD